MMELRVLGPVEVRACGRVLAAGRPQQVLVLVVLAVEAGCPVPMEVLVDRVWDQAPPRRAHRTLHTHVSRIRRLLEETGDDEAARLARRAAGYVLELDRDRVDLHRFRGLVDRARQAGRAEEDRLALLREALGLWRGEPLTGLPGEWAQRMRKGWRQQWLDAVLDWSRAEREAGTWQPVIDRLTGLVDEYPLVEPLAAELMRALYAAGRAAEALSCYTGARQRLVEQLGVDPGPELRELHRAILRGDLDRPPVPAGAAGARAAPGGGARTPAGAPGGGPGVPAQLPLDVRAFTGRARELARLDEILEGAAAEPTSVVVSAVSGTAGVGKTALAVHWAHRVAGRFPGGQLYANLRGFEPGGVPMPPAEAVRGFLDALGVPPGRVPSGLDAMAALYRSLLAGRRMLVVLDNARDEDQVRPLLPGSPGCMVVVTSRTQLSGLLAAQGAHPIALDLLTVDEARTLLAARLGAGRVAAEPHAVDEVVEACARLPLALAIAAARAAARPRLPLELLAGELRGGQGGLEAFAGGDPATDLRAVLSCSYRALSAGAARLFRLLGIHPGPDVSAAAAASLAGVPPARARLLLAELTGANLLAERALGRYSFHDLLREYAGQVAGVLETEAARQAAMRRLLDHYLHTALGASLRINRHRYPIALAPSSPGVTAEQADDLESALAWLGAERLVLLAAVSRAASDGFDAHAWQLAWALGDYLNGQGRWHEWAAVQAVALQAAMRLDDRTAWVHAHRGLARVLTQLDRHGEAEAHLSRCLDLCVELGDGSGQALTYLNLGFVRTRRGDHLAALGHSQRALDLYRAAGNRAGQANALNTIGWCHAQLGDHRQALASCQQALPVHQELGDRDAEAATWDSLAYAHHQLGEHAPAIACYRRSLELCRQLGERYYEAVVLDHLGDVHRAVGEEAAALHAWQGALAVLDELGHPEAERIRAKLGGGDLPAAGSGQPAV